MVAGVIAAILLEGTLPEPLRNYAATEELPPFLVIVGLILLVLLVVAWVGLWRNASWAPAVYAIMWVSCVVTVPFSGPYVGTAIEEMFDFVGTSAGGGILALVLLTMQERRNSELPLGGRDTTLEAANDAAAPKPSDEHVQAHMKSSRAHRLVSWLYGFIAIMLLGFPYVAWTDNEALGSREMAVAWSIPLFFFGLAISHHFVSRGAENQKRWARIGSILLACLLLAGVPIGTFIGVYLLRNSSWELAHTVGGS